MGRSDRGSLSRPPRGTGPQAYDHIVLRLAGRWAEAPSILRCDVERCTLLQMIAQGFGVSIAGQATALVDIPSVVFRRSATSQTRAVLRRLIAL